jgi:hypothetical protein
VASDERSRLHEIVDRLPEDELGLACRLLELLTHGSAALRAPRTGAPDGARDIVAYRDGLASLADLADLDDDDNDDADEEHATSPETLAMLARLTDDELIRLDELLASDREGARRFWRERFGEELPDDDFVQDGHA